MNGTVPVKELWKVRARLAHRELWKVRARLAHRGLWKVRARLAYRGLWKVGARLAHRDIQLDLHRIHSHNHCLSLVGPSLMLSEFPSKGYSGPKKTFNNSDKMNFYTDSGKTVLLSQLMLTVEERSNPIKRRLITTSGKGKHAEEAFIKEVNKVLTKERKRYNIEELKIDMLVSYSPCFKCHQELEHFLTNLENLKVYLTLKVGSLYKDGFTKEEAEKKLAFWINDLEVQGVTVCLEAIFVLSELPMTRIHVTDKKREHRDEADDKIAEHVENINQHYQDVQALMKSLSKKEKKTFLKDGDPMVLGELTVSAFVDHHRVPTTVVKLTKRRK